MSVLQRTLRANRKTPLPHPNHLQQVKKDVSTVTKVIAMRKIINSLGNRKRLNSVQPSQSLKRLVRNKRPAHRSTVPVRVVVSRCRRKS